MRVLRFACMVLVGGLLFVLALVALSCKTPSAPTNDASDSAMLVTDGPDPVLAACANLASLGCAEGAPADAGVDCPTIYRRVLATRLENVDLACMTAATSKDAIRACPNVTCP